MLVIGLLLVLVALVTIGFMVFGTRGLSSVEVDLGAFAVNLTPLWLFLAGALAVLVLSVGLALLSAGLRRRQRQRRELKELRHRAAVLERDQRPARPAEDEAPGGAHRNHDRVLRPEQTDRVVRDDEGSADTAAPADRTGGEEQIHLPHDRRHPPAQG